MAFYHSLGTYPSTLSQIDRILGRVSDDRSHQSSFFLNAKTTVCKAEDTAESTSGDAPCLSSLHPSRPYVPTSPHDAASGTVPKKRPMPNQSHPLAKRLCTAMATLPSKGAPESESGGGASAALALQPAAKQVSQAEPTALEHSHTEGRPDGPPPPRSVPSSKPSPGETVTATPSGGVLEDAGDAAKGKRLDPLTQNTQPWFCHPCQCCVKLDMVQPESFVGDLPMKEG